MQFSLQLAPNSGNGLDSHAAPRRKWKLAATFTLLWWINEWIRFKSTEPEDASSVALRSSLSEAIKLILSIIFYSWRRRFWVCRGRGTRKVSGVEEEQPLNDTHELPERRRNGSLSNVNGNGNGWVHSPHSPPSYLPPWLSILLVVAVALLLVCSTYTNALTEALTDTFTLYLVLSIITFFVLLGSFIYLSRTFETQQWQAILIQFCGLSVVQASLVILPLPQYAYPIILGLVLSTSFAFVLLSYIYSKFHSTSFEALHILLFATAFLTHIVILTIRRPPHHAYVHHFSRSVSFAMLRFIPQAVLELTALAVISHYDAVTLGVLMTTGAAVYLLFMSITSGLHHLPVTVGCSVAMVGALAYFSHSRAESDEKSRTTRRGNMFYQIGGGAIVFTMALFIAVSAHRERFALEFPATKPASATEILVDTKITCRRKPLQSFFFYPHERKYHAFDNVLLIVFFSHARYDVNLDYYKEVYSEFFPNIVFVGPGSREDGGFEHSYDVLVDSYESDEDLSDPSFYKMAGRMAHHMLYTAMREFDCYDGYLWAPFDALLNIPRLQQFDQDLFWYHSPFGEYVPNVALGDALVNANKSHHPPPLNVSPDPALNVTENWRGWGYDWWWGEPHVGLEICMQAFRNVPLEMRENLAQKTNGTTRLLGGSADTLYIPGRHRQNFMDILSIFLETNCFLEIATPTTVHLVLPPDEPILYVDHWWIWQPPFNATFVRKKWEEGFEVDTFHTFHWGDRGLDGIWRGNPKHIPDVRRLLQESAARQQTEFPIRTIERDDTIDKYNHSP